MSVDITAALWEVQCRERQKVIRGYQPFILTLWEVCGHRGCLVKVKPEQLSGKGLTGKEAGEEGFAHCASVNGLIKTNALRVRSQRIESQKE